MYRRASGEYSGVYFATDYFAAKAPELTLR